MSDQRTTAEQQTAAQENQELTQTSPEAELAAGQLDEVIPEKFVGKAPLDIIRSYNEVEKSFSRVSSEKAQERKAREEAEARAKALEAELNLMRTQSAQQEVAEEPETDPFAEYDEQFEQDPKRAIKSLVGKTQEQIKQERRLMQMELEQRQANEYYNTQKRDNPEYAKLEPTMLQLAQEYGDLVSPDKVNSVKALKLLHLAARGAKLDDFVSEAKTSAKKETTTIRDEKRQAYSESPSSQGDQKKSWKDLSVEEMEKLLPISRS